MKRPFFSLCAGMVGCAMVLQFPSTVIAKEQEAVLHSFGGGTDGSNPGSGLIDVKGLLYGTTRSGGNTGCGGAGCGTVFALEPSTGAETVLHSFCGKKTEGCEDGEGPGASLINVKGRLYGTTEGGGRGAGTVFALRSKTGKEKVLYSFCVSDCEDGETPEAGLLDVSGMLYGTTYGGGIHNNKGTVFALDPSTGVETTLYSFGSSVTDGTGPSASLIDMNETLYGTTLNGGVEDMGTVFAFDPETGEEWVLYFFSGGRSDGSLPSASLIDVNGTLYGTTGEGGTYGEGTVFAIDPNTGAETVVHSFGCSGERNVCKEGAHPGASLIDVKDKLYGTTYGGGVYGGGTVFALDPGTRAVKALYSFCSQQNCTDGERPIASLINVKDTLYGTTEGGGAYGLGTVFAVTR
ncbi:MAG TPA: choice-of-anchor tandem repeat GloVer-containing protein [Rhizomicrobium sp.]|nr:choice-of-anchor tandem repeat GloVer-containing protein [Rhizomicrobium sp.]